MASQKSSGNKSGESFYMGRIKEQIMNTKMIESLFETAEEDYQAAKAEFMDKCEESGFSHTFIWQAEEIAKAEQKIVILKELQNTYMYSPEQLLPKIGYCIKSFTENLINSPYWHKSTSLMSNAVDEWKAQAYSQLLRNELIRLQEWAQD